MLSTDIPQMTSKVVEIVSPSHQQGNYIPSAAIRWHDFGDRPAIGSPFEPVFHHPDIPLSSFYTSPWISSAYAGAGLGRRSLIRRRFPETGSSARQPRPAPALRASACGYTRTQSPHRNDDCFHPLSRHSSPLCAFNASNFKLRHYRPGPFTQDDADENAPA